MKRMIVLTSLILSASAGAQAQTATLEATLELRTIDGVTVPYQNGIPVPAFEKQQRTMIPLSGPWRKERFYANDALTLSSRAAAMPALLNEAKGREGRDFDDSAWARTRGPVPAASAEMALLCLRGKFAVRDPAAAGDLKLSLEVKGGTIVYLNGREVARQGMPDGKPALDDPATDYPEEAYLDPEGFLYRNGWGDDVNFKERLRARIRSLHDVTVPAAALRKGTNVLAVEIHRAAASELLLTRKTRDWSREAWRKRGHFWW